MSTEDYTHTDHAAHSHGTVSIDDAWTVVEKLTDQITELKKKHTYDEQLIARYIERLRELETRVQELEATRPVIKVIRAL